VAHALVAAVVEVDKVFLPLLRQGASINGVTVVLAGDVALTGGEVEGRNVVRTVTVLELNGAGTSSESKELVAQADAKDRNLRGLHEHLEVVHSGLAMSGITRAVGDKDAVVVVGNLLDLEIIWEDSDTGATADQAAQDVLLDTAIDESDVELGVGRLDNEGGLGANLLDQVDLAGIDKALVFVGVVLVTDGDPSKGRTLLTEMGDDSASINARDGGNALSGTPLAQALDSGPVAVPLGDIGDDDTGTLDVRRLEILEQVVLITHRGGHAIVSNKRLGEDEDLTAVRGVGHGLGVSNEGSCEDSLARDVCVGAKGCATEDGTVTDGEGGLDTSGWGGGTVIGGGHLATLASLLDGSGSGLRAGRDEASLGPKGGHGGRPGGLGS